MRPTVHSLQNSRVKAAATLRDAGQRRQSKKILIDGIRESACAANSGIEIIELFVDAAKLDVAGNDQLAQLLQRVPANCIQPITTQVMKKLSYGERHSEIVCVAKAPKTELSELQTSSNSLWLVVDHVEKPGNLGAIVRSADAAGVSGVVFTNPVCELFNPNAIRASLGTVFTVPIACASTQAAQEFLLNQGCRLIAARVDATVPYWNIDYQSPTAIVLGSEAHGLGADWQGEEIQSVMIPMRGSADSLNLSASVSILLYEAVRQRQARINRLQ